MEEHFWVGRCYGAGRTRAYGMCNSAWRLRFWPLQLQSGAEEAQRQQHLQQHRQEPMRSRLLVQPVQQHNQRLLLSRCNDRCDADASRPLLLFDMCTAGGDNPHEWRIDKTLTKPIEDDSIGPLVVVGIDSPITKNLLPLHSPMLYSTNPLWQPARGYPFQSPRFPSSQESQRLPP